METTMPDKWIRLQPPFSEPARSLPVFTEYAAALARIQHSDRIDCCDAAFVEALEVIMSQEGSWPLKDRAMLIAAVRVITDLARQRWKLRVDYGHVEVCSEAELSTDPQTEKE